MLPANKLYLFYFSLSAILNRTSAKRLFCYVKILLCEHFCPAISSYNGSSTALENPFTDTPLPFQININWNNILRYDI